MTILISKHVIVVICVQFYVILFYFIDGFLDWRFLTGSERRNGLCFFILYWLAVSHKKVFSSGVDFIVIMTMKSTPALIFASFDIWLLFWILAAQVILFPPTC